MRLVVYSGSEQVTEVVCRGEAVYIGSRAGCGIHLPDNDLPEQVGVIYPESGGGWVVQKLSDHTELRINDSEVTDKAELRSGDRITLNRYAICASLDATAATVVGGRTTVANMTRFVKFQLPQGTLAKKPEEALTLQQSCLPRIGRINTALGGCETVEQLMDISLQGLLEMFAAHNVWIGIRRVNYGPMEYVEGRTITGQAAELPRIGDDLKPRVLDRGQFLLVPRVSREERVSLLTGPLVGPDGTLGMVYLDSGESGRRIESHELDLFVVALNMIGAQLDAIFKLIAQVRQAATDGEVSVAHAIQTRLTPRKLPQWDELQFGAFRELGRQRTSDFYDVVRLGNKMAAFVITHTSAVGPAPSMLIAQVHAAFRTAAMHMDAPHIFLRSLNAMLYDGQPDHPLDCLMGAIDPPTGRLRYAVAGRVGAYIISARGEERRIVPADPLPPLGTLRNHEYCGLAEKLESGETLALFTPGMTTATNRREEVFGEERFIEILCDGFGQLASNMLKEMHSDLTNFTEGGLQPDDITVILAHRT